MLSIMAILTDLPFSRQAATLAVNLLLQTTLVLLIGLIAARIVRRRCAALQSCVLRMTLVATLLCPIASWLLCMAGVSGFRLELAAPEVTIQQSVLSIAAAPTIETAVPQPISAATSPNPIFDQRDARFDTPPMDASDFMAPGFHNPPDFAVEGRPAPLDKPAITNALPEIPQSPIQETVSTPANSWRSLVYSIIHATWMCLTGLLLVRIIVANLMMERLRRKSRTAPANITCDCRDIAQLMSVTAPPVLINERLSSPCLLGWLRPAVMIPATLHPISPDVLAHELAHLRRHDCFWSLLGHLTTALMPWQPLVWLLTRRMEQAADNVCDDYVVAQAFDRVSYARELVTIAERFPASWSSTTAAIGIAEFQSCLGSRVQRILDRSRTLSIQTGWKNFLIVTVVALTGIAVAGFLGAARNGSAPEYESTASLLVEREDEVRRPDAKVPEETIDPFDLNLAKGRKLEPVTVAMNEAVKTPPAKDQPLRSAEEVQVKGTVLKPDGTPAAGAIVRSAAIVWAAMKPEIVKNDFVPEIFETKADSEGQFTITVKTKPFGELGNVDERWNQIWKETQIAASMRGFGPAGLEFKDIVAGEPVTLRLVEDCPIRGQIVDLEGNPVRGTHVKISNARASKNEDLTAWLSSVKAGEPPWTVHQHVDREFELRLVDIPDSVTTDNNGRLEIRGLGKDRTIELTFEDENVAHCAVTVVGREMEPIQRAISVPPFEASEPVFGSSFKFAVQPSRPIIGIVVDGSSGALLPGVAVESNKLANYPYSNHRVLKTVSDSAGRIQLIGMPKAAGNSLLAIPNDDQPYFMRKIDVPDPAGIEPVEIKIELHRGIWIKGSVTDKVTHEPVAGVRLHYFPFRSNNFAQSLPEFDRDGNTDGDQTRYGTDKNGNYRLVGLPGPAIVGAESVLKSYRSGVGYDQIQCPKMEGSDWLLVWRNPISPTPKWPSVMREINPAPDVQEIRLDFELDPGLSVALRVVDETGTPVKDTEIEGLGAQYRESAVDNSVQTISDLGPNETRVLIVHQKKRNIGRVMHLKPPYDVGREVQMELLHCSTVKGRLLNAGDPMPGIVIEPRILPAGDFSKSLLNITTDSDGRFQCKLLAGCEYDLFGQGKGIQDYYAMVAENLSVKPGESKDLGDLSLTKDRKFEPVKVAINATGKNTRVENPPLAEEIRVKGTVLKPDGTPAVGATVRSAAPVAAYLEEMLGRRLIPTMNETVTDSNGQFSISVSQTPYGASDLLDMESLQYWKRTPIAASLSGFGPAWLEYREIEPGKPIVLKLIEDLVIRGQVIDLEGNPIRGTTVKFSQARATQNDDLTEWISSIKRGDRPRGSNIWEGMVLHPGLRLIDVRLIGLPEKITTDNEGKIEIRGLGKERVLQFALEGTDIAYRTAMVATREMEPLEQAISPSERSATEPFLGARFKIAVPPCRPVEGIVVDAATGDPLAGVSVESEQIANFPNRSRSPYTNTRLLKTISDKTGRFRMLGMPKGDGNQLAFVPSDDQPYFMHTVDVPNPTGFDSVEMKIELRRGLWIKGRVTVKVTHEPVPRVYLGYFPFLTNEFTAGISAFPRGGSIRGDWNRYKTDADGFYRLVGLPGRGIVGAESHFKRYREGVGYDEINASINKNADKDTNMAKGPLPIWPRPGAPGPTSPSVMHEINPAADEQEVRLDLELDPGISATIRVIDDQGNSVKGVRFLGRGIDRQTTELEDPVTTVHYLGSDEKREVHAFHKDRNLGVNIQLEPPYVAGREITAVMKPCGTVTGRLLNTGEPLDGISIDIAYLRQPETLGLMQLNLTYVKTDSEGRFRCPVIPGHEYRISLRGQKIPDVMSYVADYFTVKAGETTDLGDLEPGKRGFRPVKPVAIEPIQVAAVESDKNNPSPEQMYQFAGTVIDPEGKPASNAKIFAVGWRQGALIDPNARPLTTTDAQGRFAWNVTASEYDRSWKHFQFVASAEGHGFAAKFPRVFETTGKLRARLKPEEQPQLNSTLNENEKKPILQLVRDDVPLTGRIVGSEGQPVAGARIRITEVWSNEQESLDPWQAVAAGKQADYYSLRNSTPLGINGQQLPSVVRDVLTNDDGRFVVHGIGRERVAKVVITGPGIELAECHARTRAGETVVVPHEWDRSSDRKETYHGSDFVHVGALSIPVIGQITDIETGKPIEGMRVGDGYEGFTTMRGSRHLKAITDADGRYRLEGLPVNKSYRLLVFPNEKSTYLPGSGKVFTGSEQTELVKDFQLRAGVPLQGRAVDTRTGEAIPGHVTYYAFRSNEQLKEFPGFESLGAPHERGTDSDGRFTIPVLPGTGILTFGATDHQKFSRGQGADSIDESKETRVGNRMYSTVPFVLVATNTIALQKVDIPVGSKSADTTFQIQSGVDIVGSIVDVAGKSVSGAIAMGENSFGSWYSLKEATFKVRAFYPEAPRQLAFYVPEQEIAALYQLDKVPNEPLKITLQPSGGIRGRLLDKSGIAMSNVILSGDAVPDRRHADKRQYLTTDDEGRFEIRGLVPGHKYAVTAQKGNFYYGTILESVSIEEPQVKDLGDVTYKPTMKGE